MNEKSVIQLFVDAKIGWSKYQGRNKWKKK